MESDDRVKLLGSVCDALIAELLRRTSAYRSEGVEKASVLRDLSESLSRVHQCLTAERTASGAVASKQLDALMDYAQKIETSVLSSPATDRSP